MRLIPGGREGRFGRSKPAKPRAISAHGRELSSAIDEPGLRRALPEAAMRTCRIDSGGFVERYLRVQLPLPFSREVVEASQEARSA